MKGKRTTVKLLMILLCLNVAAVTVTAVDGLFYNDSWLQWIQKGITAAHVICLFFLGGESRLYRWSAVFKAARLIITLISTLLFTPVLKYWREYTWIFTVFSTIGLVLSYPAGILEYLGHGITAPDTRKGWIILMVTNLIWGLLGNTLSTYLVGQGSLNWSKEVLDGINSGIFLINLAFQFFYIWLLYRTIKSVKTTE